MIATDQPTQAMIESRILIPHDPECICQSAQPPLLTYLNAPAQRFCRSAASAARVTFILALTNVRRSSVCSGVLAGPLNFAEHGIDKSRQLFKERGLVWLQGEHNQSEPPLTPLENSDALGVERTV